MDGFLVFDAWKTGFTVPALSIARSVLGRLLRDLRKKTK